MESLLQDVRYGIRRLRRAPGFTAVALLTLALGIGANAALFSVLDAVLLRPLPYADPDRVAMLWADDGEGGTTWLSPREVMGYRESARGWEDVSAYTDGAANLTGGTEPERVSAARVMENAFALLGVRPLLGRALVPEDAARADEVVLLSYPLWRRRFAADPAVVGREIQVDGRTRTVVGVMPEGFHLPLDFRADQPSEVWLPLGLDPADLPDWGSRNLLAFGRLGGGVTPEAATTELDRVLEEWFRQGFLVDDGDGRLRRGALPVGELVYGDVRPALLVLFGAVGFVLLIACANVANLLLARADGRRREMGIRTALGAGRGRVFRQLLLESLLLAGAGGALGVLLAGGALDALAALDPASIPRLEGARLDPRVLGFSAAVALVTGVLFGLAPALRLSRSALSDALRDGGRGATAGRARQPLRRALVVSEVALSVMLVVGAGLLIRTLVELQRVDLGFRPERVLTARLSPPAADYPEPEDVSRFYAELLRRVEELPGVERAAAVRILPLTGTIGDWSISLEGRPTLPGENPNGDWQVVTPGYFEAVGMTLERGRFLRADDDADGPMSVVVNATMAERYWPGEEAVGKRFRMGTLDQPWLTVVGVVRPVRHNAVVEEPRAEMYVPHAQFPLATGSTVRGMTLTVRAAGDPLALVPAVREAVRSLDPDLPVSAVATLEGVVTDALSRERFTALLLGAFAGLALVLAAVGIYGVISLVVSQRTHEIGIRLALGAERTSIVRMVVGQGIGLAAAGIAVGVAGAAGLSGLLRGLVYGVAPLDAATFAAVPLLLGAVTLLACWLPARRATRVDPAVALRGD